MGYIKIPVTNIHFDYQSFIYSPTDAQWVALKKQY